MKTRKLNLLMALAAVFCLASCTNGDDTSVASTDTSALKGEDGRGIVSIVLTSTSGNVDTYTITYTDGTTSTFTVTNGTDGSQGIQGEAGADGSTPVITIGDNGNWYIDGADSGVSAKGADGQDGVDGADGTSMRTGTGYPGDSLGNDGDSYIDTSTWNYYVKENGTWVLKGNIKGDDGQDGEDGTDGRDGANGIDGTNGSDGADGKDGADGQDGADGTSMRVGSGAPSNDLGNDGDSYIDLATWDYYVKEGGVWYYFGNIKGQDGTNGADGSNGADGASGQDGVDGVDGQDGTCMRTGWGVPDNTLGNDGDSYIDLATWNYYTKSGGIWNANGNIKGEYGEDGQDGQDGADGTSMRVGSGAPSNDLGQNGDSYIDIATWDYYVKEGGVWYCFGNIRGKDGTDGEDGADGTNGADGKDGQDGVDGVDGQDGVDGKDGQDGTCMRTGWGAPDNTLGNDGDSYIDFETWNYYTKSGGIWYVCGNIKGQDGANGADGTDGNNAPHYGETFTVTYNLNGGTLPDGYSETSIVGWGDTLNLPTPTYYGHVFEGWFTVGDVNSSKQFYSTDAVFTNLVLYAKWSIGTYTITLDLDGGTYSGSTSLEYEYGSTYTLPTGLTKSGHKFTGWALDGVSFATSGTFNYEDITVVAQYEETQEHVINLNLNGGSYSGSTTIAVTELQEYTLPSTGITNGDKVFTGWWNGEEKWDFTGIYELEDDIWLAAGWEDLYTYNLSFSLHGGSTSGELPTSITNKEIYEGAITLEAPVREGFTFYGYFVQRQPLVDSEGNIDNSILYASTTTTITARYISDGDPVVGNLYEMGEYPQSEVTDETLISALSDATDSDGDGYVEYGGKEYAKMSGQSNNGYSASATYYFEVEPILWDVKSDGTLISESIIDAKQFYTSASSRTYQGATIYPNNYDYSEIRAFMNGYDGSAYGVGDYTGSGFYDFVFTEEEKAEILTTAVDNSVSTTCMENGTNKYVCNNTSDKVFLLSYLDATQSIYGFSGANLRIKYASDYSIYQGLYFYDSSSRAGYWWLRSPHYYFPEGACNLTYDGIFNSYVFVGCAYGFVPALKITL